jgi:cell wall-associated NlpC family hydrolase
MEQTMPMSSRCHFLSFALAIACLATEIAQASQSNRAKASSTVVDVYGASQCWVASFTRGASTVVLVGPARTFSERTTPYAVTHSFWIRTLPSPFAGTVDETWLKAALAANQAGVADILGIAMQYTEGAPPVLDNGLGGTALPGAVQIAGDASYGPLLADGTRQEGSDFNDYLGVSWVYPNGQVDAAEAAQISCVDCSGYMRMVWGFRHSFAGSGYADTIPLCLSPLADRSALPRRSFEICASGPGILLIPNTGTQVANFAPLMPGDLVFFDASTDDGTQIDHVGMYLGVDASGKHRFISSRKSIDGPTLGDYRGASILEGTGLYARGFRAARRL